MPALLNAAVSTSSPPRFRKQRCAGVQRSATCAQILNHFIHNNASSLRGSPLRARLWRNAERRVAIVHRDLATVSPTNFADSGCSVFLTSFRLLQRLSCDFLLRAEAFTILWSGHGLEQRLKPRLIGSQHVGSTPANSPAGAIHDRPSCSSRSGLLQGSADSTDSAMSAVSQLLAVRHPKADFVPAVSP